MNAVNIPRFTGEASLYRSRGYYCHAQAADSHAHIVVPQLRCHVGERCIACAHGNYLCTACLDGGLNCLDLRDLE
jgi:hypothetical protein